MSHPQQQKAPANRGLYEFRVVFAGSVDAVVGVAVAIVDALLYPGREKGIYYLRFHIKYLLHIQIN